MLELIALLGGVLVYAGIFLAPGEWIASSKKTITPESSRSPSVVDIARLKAALEERVK